MEIRFLIVGDASGRRVQAFVDCLKCYAIAYKVMTWHEIVRDIAIFAKNLKEATIVKLEPPEKDMEIYRAFLQLGVCGESLQQKEIEQLDFSNYQIIAPQQWYAGFKTLLGSMEKISKNSTCKNVFFMHDFQETLIMLDKSETYKFLADKVNESMFHLPEKLTVPLNYREFIEMYGANVLKCFIKLRYGSGGTGIVAYSNNPKLGQEKIFTSLKFEKVKDRPTFFSNNKVSCYHDKAIIKETIDWVLCNGAHIERWIPKSTYQGYAFDTRSFVINRKSAYLVSRLSKSPITNLHLRNKRMESADIMSKEDLEMIARASEDVMKVFHKSLYGGIDVVYAHKPYIIDVNPFGDLFHHLLGSAGHVYHSEIKQAIERLRGNSR